MDKKKKIIIGISLGIVFTFILGIMFLVLDTYKKEAKKLEVDNSELKNKIIVLTESNKEKETKNLVSVGGFDSERFGKDKELIEKFMKRVFDWDSYEKYMNVRKEIMSEFSIDEKSPFMESFMPPVLDRVAPNGKHYNRIDVNHLNMSYDGLSLYPISNAGDYRYMVATKIKTKSDLGATSTSEAIFIVSVSDSGKLSNIEGYITGK